MCDKRKRQWLTVEDKLAIINQHENGTTFAKIARDKGMNESSVRKIVKDKEKYKELGKITASSSVKIRRKRSTILINMERLLSIWIEDCHQKRIPLSQTIIKHKALSLFNVMKEREGDNTEECNFEASRGWFDRFRKRYEIHNVRICGESASADNEAASKFPDILQRVIKEGGFTEQQIFNVDETGLFWKSMPTRTYVPKGEKLQQGFKTAKERLTLLLGGNAAGDMKLKPMLVYKSKHPRAFRNFTMNDLPVIWKSNAKAWVTKELFEDWFLNYFCPASQQYCKIKNIDFKILLLLDNAPGHPSNLGELNENVTVLYFPPNTTSLIQPMDQGVIATFKAYYIRRTFAQAISLTTGENSSMLLPEFWKKYDIKKAVENIDESWKEVTSKNMKDVWNKILLNRTNETPVTLQNDLQNLSVIISEMGQRLSDNTLDSVTLLDNLQTNFESYSDNELILLEEDNITNKSDEEVDEKKEAEMQMDKVENIIKLIENACNLILDHDPNVERSSQARNKLDNAIRCYKMLQAEKHKKMVQPTLDKFVRKQ